MKLQARSNRLQTKASFAQECAVVKKRINAALHTGLLQGDKWIFNIVMKFRKCSDVSELVTERLWYKLQSCCMGDALLTLINSYKL